jgi:hypothetical protein
MVPVSQAKLRKPAPKKKTAKKKVGLDGAFGVADLEFGVNPNDEPRAKAAIKEAFLAGKREADFATEVEQYLLKKGATREHIEKQLARVKRRWKQWAR